jgi:hypothetical protein
METHCLTLFNSSQMGMRMFLVESFKKGCVLARFAFVGLSRWGVLALVCLFDALITQELEASEENGLYLSHHRQREIARDQRFRY